MKAYEVWIGDSYSSLVPQDYDKKDVVIDGTAICKATIYASSWEEAMTQYHELMGWEPYVPM